MRRPPSQFAISRSKHIPPHNATLRGSTCARRQISGLTAHPLALHHPSARLLSARPIPVSSHQRRTSHHIFPAPQPLKFPEGYHSLLPIVLGANNLALPPTAEFEHGYGDPDGIFRSIVGLEYNTAKLERPLKVASRTPWGSMTAEERVVPFFVSHHPPPVFGREHTSLYRDQVNGNGNGSRINEASPSARSGPPKPIGWLIPEVAAAISRDHLRHFQKDSASPWDVRYFEPNEMESPGTGDSAFDVVTESGRRQMVRSVAFADWVNEGGDHARTLHVERLLLDWKRKKVFAELLKGWSGEAYPVFNHPSPGQGTLAFEIERAALPIFGLANYGALLTGYVHDPSTNETKLWIPRRSKNKVNSPGQLDVTAGGGMRLGDTPLSTVLREASEEALFDSEYLMTYLRAVGTVPFLHRSHNLPTCPKSIVPPSSSSSISQQVVDPHHTYSLSEHPELPTSPLQQQYILPGHYYLYELPLPVDLTVRPQRNVLDPEVDAFHLLTLDSVLENLCKGQFKRSSALAIIDFLVRGGWITEENDVFYSEVLRVLRGSVGGGSVPVPWRSIPT